MFGHEKRRSWRYAPSSLMTRNGANFEEPMGLKPRPKPESVMRPRKVAVKLRKFVNDRHKSHTLMVIPSPRPMVMRFLCLECELLIDHCPTTDETKEQLMGEGW
jgi:hypothetical protein